MSQIPETVHGFNIYLNGGVQIGIADVTIPNIQHVTDTLKGAGIAGEVEMIVQGYVKQMSMQLNFHAVTDGYWDLAAPTNRLIVARAGIQYQDLSDNSILDIPLRIIANAQPKGINLGKLETGAKQGTTLEFAVQNLQVYWRPNVLVLDVNPLLNRFVLNGTNFLASLQSMI